MQIFRLIIIFFLIFSSLPLSAQKAVRTQENNAFWFGEKITYKVRYNLYFNINVGEINFEIKPQAQEIAGNKCYHITAIGSTYSFYDNFYRVRDRYESYVEVNSLLPLLFVRDVQEGSFKFNEYVVFNQQNHMAKSKKRTQKIPEFTQDVLSAIYYARTLDYKNAKIGQPFYLNTFIDDTTYHVGVKYMGVETIKTDQGKFRCIKLKPILVVDRIFKSDEDMTLWVTDDENRIPVRIESGISVGAIRADLYKYSNLKNTMRAKL